MNNTIKITILLALLTTGLTAYSQVVTSEIEVKPGDSTIIKVNGQNKIKVDESGVVIEDVAISTDSLGRVYLGGNDAGYVWLGTKPSSPDVILRGNSHMSVNTITNYDSQGMPNFPNGLVSKGNIRIGMNFGQRYIGTMDGSYLYFGVNGGGNLIIRSDGVTVGNFQSFSDRRIKSQFRQLTNASELLRSIDFYDYHNKLSGNKESGVIADELATVIPHLVSGSPNQVDDEGKPQYQSVNYTGLITYLGAALKESLEKIEKLEKRVKNLENDSDSSRAKSLTSNEVDTKTN